MIEIDRGEQLKIFTNNSQVSNALRKLPGFISSEEHTHPVYELGCILTFPLNAEPSVRQAIRRVIDTLDESKSPGPQARTPKYEHIDTEADPLSKSYKKWRITEKGKKAHSEYAKSDKGKKAHSEYSKSDKGKLSRAKYYRSPKGQVAYEHLRDKQKAKKELAKKVQTWLEQHPGKATEDYLVEHPEALKLY